MLDAIANSNGGLYIKCVLDAIINRGIVCIKCIIGIRVLLHNHHGKYVSIWLHLHDIPASSLTDLDGVMPIL